MTDAPDMIWTAPTKSRCFVGFPEPSLNYCVPYRLSTLPRPEDAKRIAELEAALAKMQRSRDRYREEWERAKARESILSEAAAERSRQ